MSGSLFERNALLVVLSLLVLVLVCGRPSFGEERGVEGESTPTPISRTSPAAFSRFSAIEREVLLHWLGLYGGWDEAKNASMADALNLTKKEREKWNINGNEEDEGPLVPLRVDDGRRIYLPLGKDSRRAILQIFQSRGHLLRSNPIRLTKKDTQAIDRIDPQMDTFTHKRLRPRFGDTIDTIRTIDSEQLLHQRSTIEEIFLVEDPHDGLPRLFTLLQSPAGEVVSAWWIDNASVKMSQQVVAFPIDPPLAHLSIDPYDESLSSRLIPALQALLPEFVALSKLDGPSSGSDTGFSPLTAFSVWSLSQEKTSSYLIRYDSGPNSCTVIAQRRGGDGSLSLDPLSRLWGHSYRGCAQLDCFRFVPRYGIDLDRDGDFDVIGEEGILIITPDGPIQVNQPNETGLSVGSISHRVHWCHM